MAAMDNEQTLERFKADCGLENTPTKETMEYRLAPSGEGPHAYTWTDKPHRLVYDLCAMVEAQAAAITALEAENERLREAGNAALRAANLALFVIRKQDVMPNSSWQAGFERDTETARATLEGGQTDAG